MAVRNLDLHDYYTKKCASWLQITAAITNETKMTSAITTSPTIYDSHTVAAIPAATNISSTSIDTTTNTIIKADIATKNTTTAILA